MKKMLLALVLLPALSNLAYAGGMWKGATVLGLTAYTTEVTAPGWVQIHLSRSSTGGPTCGSTNKAYVAVDTSTAAGAFAAAMAQQAFALGQTVKVSGTGACNLNSVVETVASLSNGT